MLNIFSGLKYYYVEILSLGINYIMLKNDGLFLLEEGKISMVDLIMCSQLRALYAKNKIPSLCPVMEEESTAGWYDEAELL